MRFDKFFKSRHNRAVVQKRFVKRIQRKIYPSSVPEAKWRLLQKELCSLKSESDIACYEINAILKFSQFIFIWRETEMRDNLEHVLSEIHIGVTGKGTYFTVTMAVKQALYCVGWLSPCIHTVDDGLIDFFNGWSSSGSTSRVTTSGTRHVWHTAWHTTTSTLVHLGDDWCADLFQFLLLVLEFILNIKVKHSCRWMGVIPW